MAVHSCERCGLVQIVDPIDPDILFKDYAFASSTVAPLVTHFDEYAAWLDDRFHPKRVVEFGCNDGILLEPLGTLGVEAIGVDISENITEIGRQRGLDIVTGYFDAATAEQLLERAGHADVVTGSNAFAHNADPAAILEAAAAILLHPEGHLCLEMMYAGDLLEQTQWDTLYHEHLTFYSLGTVRRLLDRHGFTVVHAERIPMHGGSLRVVASQARVASAVHGDARDREGRGRNGVERPVDVDRVRRSRPTQDRHRPQHAGTAVPLGDDLGLWRGRQGNDVGERLRPHLLGRDGRRLAPPRRTADARNAHTNRVSGQLRAEPPDYIFVTAWNYADVIRKNEGWYDGTWVTPLPDMRFF